MISPKLKKIISDDKKYLFQNYGDRLPVCFVKGDNSYLYDQDNKKYIDFLSGIAVSNLGYSSKSLKNTLHKQIDNIIHSSNWFLNKEQIEAAKLISELSFTGKTLFVNSGTEANEAAIKLARKYGLNFSKNRYQIVSFTNSFHGRTLGSMTVTAQKKIHENFGPLIPGFKYLPYNDIEKFKTEIKNNKNIAAIFIELIQGEGGIIKADKNYIKELFSLCKKNKILIIVDEIQTGIGRTGKVFSYEHYNAVPDIITIAKGLGGGVPIGAIHAKTDLLKYLDKGSHGSTFGGNHFASAAAVAVLKEMKKGTILQNTNKVSTFIFNKLQSIKNNVDFINDIRGLGLHIGIELNRPGFNYVTKALAKGLIINCTSNNVLRIMPPLNISMKVAKEGMKIFEDILINEVN